MLSFRGTANSLRPSSNWALLRLVLLLSGVSFQSILTPTLAATGGEIAFYDTHQMTPNVSYRQNMCARMQGVINGTLALKDGLEGVQLRALMGAYNGAFFNYDPERGINADNPGLAAVLLDEIARRGKFTWRESFGIFVDPGFPPYNESWTDVLAWGADVYDINIDWWPPNLERMGLGVAFTKDWYDSSVLLIKQEEPVVISDEINMWNWLRPYEANVWLLTIATIIISGLVYQWLEWLQDEQGDRSLWEWWLENWYLSAINFTQAYEYQPTSLAARVFGISMAVWALVMTATYTANLASLLVDRKAPPVELHTLAEAAVFGKTICTIAGHNSDMYIRDNFPQVVRREIKEETDLYFALRRGECDFAADTVASWRSKKGVRHYNPVCDLVQVGGDRIVKDFTASFATKADSGILCTGLVRDVVNYHMRSMVNDGFLKDAWDREYARHVTIDCATWRPELEALAGPGANATDTSPDLERQRQLRLAQHHDNKGQHPYHHHHQRRELKAGGKAAAGGAVAAAANGESEKLTVEQMFGTFAFHWFMMVVALLIGHFTYFHEKYLAKQPTIHTKALNVNKETCEPSSMGNDNPESKEDGCQHTEESMLSTSVNSNSSTKDSSSRLKDMESKMTAMVQSQALMHDFQKQMMEEQRELQRQIQILVTSNVDKPNDVLGKNELEEEITQNSLPSLFQWGSCKSIHSGKV